MPCSVDRIDVWSGRIKDCPGGLAAKINPLAEAGADLEFLVGRRDKKGVALVFLAPLKGAKQLNAAKKVGLSKNKGIQALRVVGPNKAGIGAKVMAALSDAAINVRGVSGTAIGNRCAMYIAFDNAKDLAKSRRALKKIL